MSLYKVIKCSKCGKLRQTVSNSSSSCFWCGLREQIVLSPCEREKLISRYKKNVIFKSDNIEETREFMRKYNLEKVDYDDFYCANEELE
jgi:hypothetical protein